MTVGKDNTWGCRAMRGRCSQTETVRLGFPFYFRDALLLDHPQLVTAETQAQRAFKGTNS